MILYPKVWPASNDWTFQSKSTERQSNTLITGISGHLGYNLAQYLLSQGHKVSGFGNQFYNPLWSISNLSKLPKNKLTYEPIDLRNFQQVYRFIKKTKPETIIHLAAKTSVPECQQNSETAYAVNVKGALNLIDSVKVCCPTSKLIMMSTDHVFGELGPNTYPIETFFKRRPKNIYAKTKAMAEDYCRVLTQEFDLNTFVLRSVNMFGRGQRIKPNGAVIPNFITQALRGNSLELKSNVKRTFIHVLDVVDAIRRIMNLPPDLGKCRVFHVSDLRNELTISELAKKIANIVSEMTGQKKVTIDNKIIEKSYEERRLSLSSEFTRKTLKWTPSKKTMDYNLKDTIKYYAETLGIALRPSERCPIFS